MTILNNDPEHEFVIEFVQFRKPLSDDEFFLIRQVNGIPTHWLTPYGQWVGFPEDDDEAAKFFAKLIDDMDWPQWGTWEGVTEDEEPENVDGY